MSDNLPFMHKSERRLYEEAIRRGYKVCHYGFPDFLIVDPVNLECAFFVEVKANSGLTSNQKRTFPILRQIGFEIIMSRNGLWVSPKLKRTLGTPTKDIGVCLNMEGSSADVNESKVLHKAPYKGKKGRPRKLPDTYVRAYWRRMAERRNGDASV